MTTGFVFSFLSSPDLPLVRPLSLGTLEILRRMGVTLLDPEVELSPEEEALQIALYQWLHVSPLEEVHRALWNGAWRAVVEEVVMPECNALIAMFRVERDRLAREIAAATIAIRPKPRHRDAEAPPASVVTPSLYDYRLMILMKVTHQPRAVIEWDWPLVEALRMYHAALWSEGVWTVKPGEEVTEDDFDDFILSEEEREDG